MNTDTQATALTQADLDVVRKAHAMLVLLGAKWGKSDPWRPASIANVTFERSAELVAELLSVARRAGTATSGGLIVSGDEETGYELAVVIGNLGDAE